MAPNEQRELENLSVRLTRLEQDTKEQNVMLVEMRDMMVSARGSWKTVMACMSTTQKMHSYSFCMRTQLRTAPR